MVDGGAGGAPDTIQVVSSAKTSYSVPLIVVEDHPQTATKFVVNSTLGVADGDVLIAVPKVIDVNNWCGVFTATSINTGAANWYYDDDDNGNLDARITLTRPSNGWMDIWVGTHDGSVCDAVLTLETFNR